MRFLIMQKTYDLIVVGTGFGASFFLKRFLERSPANIKVLVLEKGQHDTYDWQIRNNQNSSTNSQQNIINTNPDKPWSFTLGFGGGSNCWWACTPRFLPNDMRMKSTYGVSEDWPISYDDLEPYYCQAESIMNISGPVDTPFPMSQQYPLPAHNPSSVDQLLLKKYPETYFLQATARASRGTDKRPRCCSNGICHRCPIQAKFIIQNEFKAIYNDHRVEFKLNCSVNTLITKADVISGVTYQEQGLEREAYGDLVVLGANALFNPAIIQQSNIVDNSVGKYLNEQTSIYAEVDLAEVDNYNGSSSITGQGYQFYDGEHRKEHAACLIESYNTLDTLRIEEGKWRKRVVFKLVFEDIPDANNRVTVDKQTGKPLIHFSDHSSYAYKAKEAIKAPFEQWLQGAMKVEKIRYYSVNNYEAHILGTTRMGHDPQKSTVDSGLVHHQYRNLIVTGSSVFSSCPPANPSLSISALSLMAADKLLA